MNAKRVLVSSLSVLALLASLTGGAYAKEQTKSAQSAQETSTSKYQNVEVDSDSNLIIGNIGLLGKYVTFGDDGFYHINEDLKKQVDKKTYKAMVKLNDQINEMIKSGAINLDEKGNLLPTVQTMSDYYEDYEYYWWGTHYILNRENADNLQEDLEDSSDTYQYIAIAAALAPEGATSKIIAGIAQVISIHHDNIADDIDDNKTSRGVYLDLDWTEWFYNVYPR